MGLQEAYTRYDELKARLAETNEALTGMRFSGRSDDKRITATVTAAGHLVSLDIDPRVFRHPDSAGLAASILSAAERARIVAAEVSTERWQAVLGPGVQDVGAAGGVDAETVRAVGAHVRSRSER